MFVKLQYNNSYVGYFVFTSAFLHHSHGQYSEIHAERVSQMVGSFGKEIKEITTSQVAGTYMYQSSDTKHAYEEDVAEFVSGKVL